MSKYIGTPVVNISADTVDVTGDITTTDSTPEVTIVNNTHEDTDGGREGKVTFKGQQSGGEETTLAQIQASHDGTSDDEKGDLIFKTNDGSDGASPTERVRIDSNGSILTATLGTDNVHLGEGAGSSIVSGGNNNVVIGKNAGTAITTGDANVAIGEGSLASNNTADNNTAVGKSALNANTTGTSNTAVGKDALATNQTSNSNTAIGKGAGSSTTVAAGTYVGSQAGENTNSVSNTFIGCSAGENITSGEKNTILGRYNGNENGLDIRTSSNNIVLSDGDGNTRFVANSSGQISVGDSFSFGGVGYSTTQFTVNANNADYSAAFNSNTTTASQTYGILVRYASSPDNTGQNFITCSDNTTTRFEVTSDGDVKNHDNSYGAISDQKLKENIEDASSQWNDIKALRVRKYSMKIDNASEANRLGVIAQEVEAAGMSGLVTETPDLDDDRNDLGTVTKAVKYSILYMKAVKALQEAMTRIETLETQNTTQATQIADLITRVTALEGE